MQENRSFDSYFGTYPGRGRDPRTRGKPRPCAVRSGPAPARLRAPVPRQPRRQRRRPARHAGVLDRLRQRAGWTDSSRSRENCTNALDPRDCIANLSVDMMGYHDQREIPNYWTYAKQLRAPGPHVRAGRLVEPAGPPLSRLGVVRAMHDPGGPVQLQEQHRAPGAADRHRAAALEAARLRLDRPHVSAPSHGTSAGATTSSRVRSPIARTRRCSAPTSRRRRARPGSGIRCRASTRSGRTTSWATSETPARSSPRCAATACRRCRG